MTDEGAPPGFQMNTASGLSLRLIARRPPLLPLRRGGERAGNTLRFHPAALTPTLSQWEREN